VQPLVPMIAYGHPNLLGGEWTAKSVRKEGNVILPSLKNPSNRITTSVNETPPHSMQFPFKVPVWH
jgi:hypothetical protein